MVPQRAILFGLVLLTAFSLPNAFQSQFSPVCKAWLVQSVPTDMPHLFRVPGLLSTSDVFIWLASNSTQKLDIITQTWQLIASPDDPRSGDYGYSQSEMRRFGAHEGFEVYRALEDAADRNVNIRLLSHSGVYPDYTKEPSKLASGRPNVKNATLLLDDWWGSGIIHAKIWISDRQDVYIGSANNDWKSFTQVKELGIYFSGCPTIAEKVETYFDNLWTLVSLNSSAYTKTVSDQQWQVDRKVPCWSYFVDSKERCKSPLPEFVETPHVSGYPILSDPDMFEVSIQTPGYHFRTSHSRVNYLSFAPPELSYGRYQADEQAWIDTIKSVGTRGTVCINTMDWLGQSQYMKQPVFWSSISSAVSEVVFSKSATVKILIEGYWAFYVNNADQYLKSLLYTNILCASSKSKCDGKVEIKYFVVPGFNTTGPAAQEGRHTGNIYPARTRYTHGKYAVSDVRANIGTSNLIWDHFYTTAGISYGTYNSALVSQLKQVFDADWNSPYTVPVQELKQIRSCFDCSI